MSSLETWKIYRNLFRIDEMSSMDMWKIQSNLSKLNENAIFCVDSLEDMNSYCDYYNTDQDIEDFISEHVENLTQIQDDLKKNKEIAENLIREISFRREVITPGQKYELRHLSCLVQTSRIRLKHLEEELSRVLEKKIEIFNEIKRFVQRLPRPKIRERCTCRHYTRYDVNPVKITACGICYSENLIGIQPACCQGKQEICLECMTQYFQSEYKSGLERKKSGPVANRKIFSIHYHCPFCRNLGCFKKYKHVFCSDS